MKLWHDAGHFSNEMMVRNGDNGVFTSLGSLGAGAFVYDAESAFKDALKSIERVLDKYQQNYYIYKEEGIAFLYEFFLLVVVVYMKCMK